MVATGSIVVWLLVIIALIVCEVASKKLGPVDEQDRRDW